MSTAMWALSPAKEDEDVDIVMIPSPAAFFASNPGRLFDGERERNEKLILL